VWELFHLDQEINPLISHVQDRKLWLFKLKNTREILAALNSYPMDFTTWNQLFNTPLDSILKEGIIVRRYQTELTKTVIKNSTRLDFLGYPAIPIVNCPWFIMSEVVGILSNTELFAVGYFDTYNKRHFSLRASIRSKVNVLKLARHFGGGGHKNAAGFTANTTDNNLILGKLFNEG
jgi:nanoRNase/pAp phosphatase (c-di-AMP/oligoRNAs hydrolase)